MDIRIDFPNLIRIQTAIIASGAAGAVAAAQALRHEGQEAFLNSQDEVPVDFGALKKSGRLLPQSGGVISDGANIKVEVVYGSTAADYAIYVHENMTAHHPHGKAKYVEGPLTRQTFGIAERIAAKVEAVQKGVL